MSTAVSIVILIAVVTAAGLLRDSLRTNAVTRWAKSRGFTVVPKSEHDTKQLMAWAGRFHPDSCGHWGNVLRGGTGGRETVIAEHEEKRLTSPDRWHTLAVTRVPGLQMQAIRIIAAGSPVVRGVTDDASAPGRAVREHLGIEVTEKPTAHPVGKGMWAVDTTDTGARAYWSGEIGAAAIDAWPHDAELAAIDVCVLVRIPGLINAERLDDLLATAESARSLFTEASTRMSSR